MEKLIEILTNIVASIQVICNAVLSLLFQPLFYLISIIQGIIEVWQEEEPVGEFEAEPPQQQVTVYPSANEGKYAEECELPIGRPRIGFKNQHELEELEKIKRQLKGEN